MGDGVTEQLYQVWDWQKGDVHSYHADRQAAVDEATRLNAVQAMDWNGLPRYQVATVSGNGGQ